MPNPPDMLVFRRRLPPKGQREYYPVLTQGDEADTMLQTGEDVTDFVVSLTAEAIAAGLRLLGGDKAPRYEDLVFVFWVDIDPARRGDATFQGTGADLGVEIYYETSLDRHDDFTVGVRAVNL